MYFDNNYLDIFINNKSISRDTLILNTDRFYSAHEGFIRGNLFKDLYDPYKNYHVKDIIPNNEKDSIILKIYELDFAINDLNLYLDIYSNDEEAFSLFKKYVEEYKKYCEVYEKNYGPLKLIDCDASLYNWNKEPFPWERSEINV